MQPYQDDPVYLDSRREALVILAMWSACFFWTVTYCYANGYTEHPQIAGEATSWLPDLSSRDRTPDSLTLPFGIGIPDWVFWGIAVPWVISIAASTWFCFCYMSDDERSAALNDGGAA